MSLSYHLTRGPILTVLPELLEYLVELRAHSPIPGGSGVLDVNMTGSGEVTIFRDGQVIEGTWERADVADPLVLRDADGREIELTAGQTWIEIVEPTTPLHIQQ